MKGNGRELTKQMQHYIALRNQYIYGPPLSDEEVQEMFRMRESFSLEEKRRIRQEVGASCFPELTETNNK